MGTRRLASVIFLLALACSGASRSVTDPIDGIPAAQQRAISRFDFQDDWPFEPGVGTLACSTGAVVFRANGTTYALNDTARSRGYASADPIRLAQSGAPSNPLRRIRQEDRVRIFRELRACDTTADASGCRQRIARERGLASDELQQIDVEGRERSWPPLTPALKSMQRVLDTGRGLCRN
jgi:hypothetical protein